MGTKTKPTEETLKFLAEEEKKFWELNKSLLNEMRNSWKAAGKPFPSSWGRPFLETYYAGENGLYGPDWTKPGTPLPRIYFPEKKYRELVKFVIDKHNLVVQSIRDDAKGIREYEEWLKTQKTPFDQINETVKNFALLAGVLIAGYLIIK